MVRRTLQIVSLAALLAASWSALAGPAGKGATTRPAGAGKKPPATDLEYWLNQAKPATSQPAKKPDSGRSPFGGRGSFRRSDALPGVVEFSDGIQSPGGLYTTRDKPWVVWEMRRDAAGKQWVPVRKRWRRIPFITVLSMTAVIVEEEMVQEWRWKGMGIPERVYTGREYPTRRVMWKFRLIDGSTITGEIKGQPLWVEVGDKTVGPVVLHERSKGKMGQKLKDLVYIKRILVSQKMMDKVIEHLKSAGPKKAKVGR